MKNLYFTILMAFTAMLGYAQVTPPASATIETWYVTYTFVSSNGQESSVGEEMSVAFDGNTVYFQMPHPFSAPYKTWVKGTIDGSTAVFAKGQDIAQYDGKQICLAGSTGQDVTDVTLLYSSTEQTFTALSYILYNIGDTNYAPLAYFYPFSVSKEAPKTYEPVAVPAGLETEDYVYTASSLYSDGRGGWQQEQVAWPVKMGFSGDSVYVQGLCRMLYNAWIAGKRDADGSLTFASGQYYGRYADRFDFFFAAATAPASDPLWADDMVFTLNNGSYQTEQYMLLNRSAKSVSGDELYAGGKLLKPVEKAATPASPRIVAFLPYDDQQACGVASFSVPVLSTDGEPLLAAKLGYTVYVEKNGEQKPYAFTTAVYRMLPEDMTVVPYGFYDGFDFALGGSSVYFYDDLKDVVKIGIQSVYTGGGETRTSNVVWYDASTAGITATEAAQPQSVTYTDLQGRAVTAQTKGMVIKCVRMTDGTVKTTKMVRR